jgi:hypothetical protein
MKIVMNTPYSAAMSRARYRRFHGKEVEVYEARYLGRLVYIENATQTYWFPEEVTRIKETTNA